MLETLKHYGFFVLHNILSALNKSARQIGQMFPERPPQNMIDIEDDINEPDDFNPNQERGHKGIERNRWGLPVIEEEQI